MSVYDMATQAAAQSRSAAAAPAPLPASEPAAPPEPEPYTPPPEPSAFGGAAPVLGKALDSIGTYIPTEVIATYLAVVAVIPSGPEHRYQWLMFWLFAAATPIVVWLGVSAAHPGQGFSLPVAKVREWPWLSMFAASLAFAVFAISVPGSVVSSLRWYEAWMSTVVVILSAFVLSQVNRIAQAMRPAAPKP